MEDHKEQLIKNEEIAERLRLAEEMQMQFKREQERDVMLKNELRKLKLEDIQKLKERQKRLEMQRKTEIMSKDQESTQYLNLVKSS